MHHDASANAAKVSSV